MMTSTLAYDGESDTLAVCGNFKGLYMYDFAKLIQ
jgi:hypothetical protein